MNKADCFHLGYVGKLHGYKGEVSLFLDVSNPEDYDGLESIFIEINNQLTPFFITEFKLKAKGHAAVKLDGVDTENDARALLRKHIYLPAEILPQLKGNQFYDHEIVGFQVIDTLYGEVGVVNQVIDFQVNPLLQVYKGKKEVLLPLNVNLVQKVDRENKILTVTAPEGLIAMYLD